MLPKISIITPTLNQAVFIEQTINSVLSQKYPNLEFLIIDGGSSDGTIEILKKYNDQLVWLSEKDDGQVYAINKGLRLSTGDIVGYLNSDDTLICGSLFEVGKFFEKFPDAKILTGKCHNVNIQGNPTRQTIEAYKNFWLSLRTDNFLKILNYMSQPSTFWRRSLHNEFGYFDVNLKYSMDYDFWLKVSKLYKIHFMNRYLANFRIYPTSITSSDSRQQFKEEYRVAATYSNLLFKVLHKGHATLSYLLYKSYFNKPK